MPCGGFFFLSSYTLAFLFHPAAAAPLSWANLWVIHKSTGHEPPQSPQRHQAFTLGSQMDHCHYRRSSSLLIRAGAAMSICKLFHSELWHLQLTFLSKNKQYGYYLFVSQPKINNITFCYFEQSQGRGFLLITLLYVWTMRKHSGTGGRRETGSSHSLPSEGSHTVLCLRPAWN